MNGQQYEAFCFEREMEVNYGIKIRCKPIQETDNLIEGPYDMDANLERSNKAREKRKRKEEKRKREAMKRRLLTSPSEKHLDHRHWTEGGTGITNFLANERSTYEEAIQTYGDPSFILSEKCLLGFPHNEEYHSLHRIPFSGTSAFLRILMPLLNEKHPLK